MSTQSRAELLAHLDEQVAFLDASCAAFDAGAEIECKRLATHVRVLIHDTANSQSVLGQLGVKATMWFFDPLIEERQMQAKAAAIGAIRLFIGGLVTIEMDDDGSRFVARSAGPQGHLGNDVGTFESWWTLDALNPTWGPPPSRRQIVLWLANKDGGAHVDRLPPTYRALTAEGAMGVRFGEPPVARSPIPAAMRQIAEELRHSLHAQRMLFD